MLNNNIVPKDEFNIIINQNSLIGCYNQLTNCNIGKNCYINSSIIDNSNISDFANVNKSVVKHSNVGNNTQIGVFSHLRPNSHVFNNVKIGNFVETKNCVIGNNTKASHLTYIGDAELGENINVGCGTIFCNYNGKIKQKTVIKNNVFIGSNTNLIAPLVVEENSVIAAGSTITKNIEKNTLAIARAYQINKQNYYKE
jgi:bifunctional UDP-N-acetylglucosamine pyrophosphorylase/glucosamine-1-phosphate N-acetyltransferase